MRTEPTARTRRDPLRGPTPSCRTRSRSCTAHRCPPSRRAWLGRSAWASNNATPGAASTRQP
eukprot:8979510-Pyramimonas_sp.AAC.1